MMMVQKKMLVNVFVRNTFYMMMIINLIQLLTNDNNNNIVSESSSSSSSSSISSDSDSSRSDNSNSHFFFVSAYHDDDESLSFSFDHDESFSFDFNDDDEYLTSISVLGQSGKVTISRTNMDDITVNMDALSEVDINGEQVGKTGKNKHVLDTFANQDFTISDMEYNQLYQGITVDTFHFETLINDNIGKLKVIYYLVVEDSDDDTTTFETETEVWEVKKGDLKWNIELSEWTWCASSSCNDGDGEYIDFDLEIKANNGQSPEKKSSSQNEDKEFQLAGNDTTLQLSNRVVIDGVETNMPEGYPMLTTKGAKDIFTFRFSKFTTSAVYDPVLQYAEVQIEATEAPSMAPVVISDDSDSATPAPSPSSTSTDTTTDEEDSESDETTEAPTDAPTADAPTPDAQTAVPTAAPTFIVTTITIEASVSVSGYTVDTFDSPAQTAFINSVAILAGCDIDMVEITDISTSSSSSVVSQQRRRRQQSSEVRRILQDSTTITTIDVDYTIASSEEDEEYFETIYATLAVVTPEEFLEVYEEAIVDEGGDLPDDFTVTTLTAEEPVVETEINTGNDDNDDNDDTEDTTTSGVESLSLSFTGSKLKNLIILNLSGFVAVVYLF